MSIDLTTTTPLEYASIQYTYPEMDIKNIYIIDTSAKKFFFRNGLSQSSFSFTDSLNSIFKSGIATEGIISNGIHKINDNANLHELTIKHLTTGGDYFYVVFPLTTGGDSSIIDEIIENTSDISISNIKTTIVNKSLNSMINSSKVYYYKNNNNRLVFVFDTPIKTANDLNAIKNTHSEWTTIKTDTTQYVIDPDLSEQVSEDIVCDSTGEPEQIIDNPILKREVSKIGYTTLVFILLAVWIGFFYSFPFIQQNITNQTPTFFGWVIILIAVLAPIITFGITYGTNKKLNMYTTPEAILVFLVLLWPIDLVFRSIIYLILNLLYSDLNIDWKHFIIGYLTNDINSNISNKSATYALSALLLIWVIAVFIIVTK
jgi:hypothetical protein